MPKSVTWPESNQAYISLSEGKTVGKMPKKKQEQKTAAAKVWQSISELI